jgi:hypothetical protein
MRNIAELEELTRPAKFLRTQYGDTSRSMNSSIDVIFSGSWIKFPVRYTAAILGEEYF